MSFCIQGSAEFAVSQAFCLPGAHAGVNSYPAVGEVLKTVSCNLKRSMRGLASEGAGPELEFVG